MDIARETGVSNHAKDGVAVHERHELCRLSPSCG
jgi:hypothetical protein